MARIVLSDDGTLDTVLRCTSCDVEFRYNFASHCEARDDFPADASPEVSAKAYDEFVDEIIAETESEHVCGSDE